ncbi:Tn3 family transposase [Chryseobacterium sp. S90]|uniref:Tn3 family transposase n=1 Tax=Chryseobacterium sp. S90 TaxID=3395373 RepID=UPI0039BCA1DE
MVCGAHCTKKVIVGLKKENQERSSIFNRLGEVRDRSFESQRHIAGGLNLVTAAIILRNTVYIEKVVQHLKEQGKKLIRNYSGIFHL